MNSAVERKTLEMKLPDFHRRTSGMIIIIIIKNPNGFHRGNPSTLITWHMLQPRPGVSQRLCFSNCALNTVEL